jgi:hypothetical protein
MHLLHQSGAFPLERILSSFFVGFVEQRASFQSAFELFNFAEPILI